MSVTVDDTACDVETISATSITCRTQAASASATGTDMPGQPGLTKTVYDPASGSTPAYDEFNSADIDETSLATTFEATERWETLYDEDMDN